MRTAKAYFKNTLYAIARQIKAWGRPSKGINEKRLRARGETIDSIRFREPGAADVPEKDYTTRKVIFMVDMDGRISAHW